MSIALSVNVNKIALLRNARSGNVPSVVDLARIALDAGAHGITVHPRPDQRHIRLRDVDELAELLASPEYADREFNIEGNPLDETGGSGGVTRGKMKGGHLMPILERVRPTQATLVPDAPDQSTSDHGFDLTDPATRAALQPIVETIKGHGSRVSVFVDPDPESAARAVDVDADRIELYTESYAKAFGTLQQEAVLGRFIAAAERAHRVGLKINAGHDLDLRNLARFAEVVPALEEVSIGHALVADALRLGMAGAVKAYLSQLGHRGAGALVPATDS